MKLFNKPKNYGQRPKKIEINGEYQQLFTGLSLKRFPDLEGVEYYQDLEWKVESEGELLSRFFSTQIFYGLTGENLQDYANIVFLPKDKMELFAYWLLTEEFGCKKNSRTKKRAKKVKGANYSHLAVLSREEVILNFRNLMHEVGHIVFPHEDSYVAEVGAMFFMLLAQRKFEIESQGANIAYHDFNSRFHKKAFQAAERLFDKGDSPEKIYHYSYKDPEKYPPADFKGPLEAPYIGELLT
ncbi:MAG: hypothetical protein ABIE22_05255 [archaeon]